MHGHTYKDIHTCCYARLHVANIQNFIDVHKSTYRHTYIAMAHSCMANTQNFTYRHIMFSHIWMMHRNH